MNWVALALTASLLLTRVSAAESQSFHSDAEWNDLRRSLAGKTAVSPAFSAAATAVREGGSIPQKNAFHVGEHAETVRRYACAMSVPPDLALAVAEQESNFIPAIGGAGELGIMQVLPATADQYQLDRNLLMDARYGVYAGLTILSELLSAFPETEAIAAYNAGSRFRQKQLPAELIEKINRYVSEVLDRRQKYRAVRCR
jgi:soluble lytic murein transglycosylase-like protein